MKKKHKNERNRIVLSIALLLAAISVLAGISYGAYTNLVKARRVITTMESEDTFSSNYLLPMDSTSDDYKSINVSYNNNSYLTVTVANFPQDNMSLYCKDDINFTLKATVLDKNNHTITADARLTKDGIAYAEGVPYIMGADVLNNDLFSVNGTKFVNGIVSITNQQLRGGKENQKAYTININPEFIDYINVKVEALPEAAVDYIATENKKLGIILCSAVSSSQRPNWSGVFSDDSVSVDCKALAGFNYQISGQGQGTIKLRWNKDYVELSPYSIHVLDSGSSAADVMAAGEMEFQVGKAGQDNLFVVQFYRTQPATATEVYDSSFGVVGNGSDVEASRYVIFEFTEEE